WPTVSDSRMLIKASFNAALNGVPSLRIGDTSVQGRMGDTAGEHWHFYASDLEPARRYRLALIGSDGRALCEPWELATFPAPDARPDHFRVLFYTCAGGHQDFTFLPTQVRNRLLRRALSFQPDVAGPPVRYLYLVYLRPLHLA